MKTIKPMNNIIQIHNKGIKQIRRKSIKQTKKQHTFIRMIKQFLNNKQRAILTTILILVSIAFMFGYSLGCDSIKNKKHNKEQSVQELLQEGLNRLEGK